MVFTVSGNEVACMCVCACVRACMRAMRVWHFKLIACTITYMRCGQYTVFFYTIYIKYPNAVYIRCDL